MYPLGDGVAAQGTAFESMLAEEGEIFASIVQQLDTGVLSLTPLPIDAPALGALWARERDRYGLACFDREVARFNN